MYEIMAALPKPTVKITNSTNNKSAMPSDKVSIVESIGAFRTTKVNGFNNNVEGAHEYI